MSRSERWVVNNNLHSIEGIRIVNPISIEFHSHQVPHETTTSHTRNGNWKNSVGTIKVWLESLVSFSTKVSRSRVPVEGTATCLKHNLWSWNDVDTTTKFEFKNGILNLQLVLFSVKALHVPRERGSLTLPMASSPEEPGTI